LTSDWLPNLERPGTGLMSAGLLGAGRAASLTAFLFSFSFSSSLPAACPCLLLPAPAKQLEYSGFSV
jgi:hypothetical protein